MVKQVDIEKRAFKPFKFRINFVGDFRDFGGH
jgi:hypothetical protein